MGYNSACFWGEGRNKYTLVLKQLEIAKGTHSLIFAGLFSEYSREIQKFTDYFFMVRRADFEKLSERLEAFAGKLEEEIKFSIFLGVDDRFIYLNKGYNSSWVLNMKFQGLNCKNIMEEECEPEETRILRGRLEQGVGILIASDEYIGSFNKRSIAECINIAGLSENRDTADGRMERRLCELGTFAAMSGFENLAAILIMY